MHKSEKSPFSLLKRSSFTIGGAQTLVGFAAATGIMESDPTWAEVRSLPLVSGHFDQLFIAISLKTPSLLPCISTSSQVGGGWVSGGTITPSCIAFSRLLTFSTIPSPSTSTLATAGRSLVADILVLRRLMIAMNFLPLQQYVHRYPGHAAISILIHSQKQFFASQLSDTTDKAWGGCLPSSGYLRPIRGALESEQWSANLLFLATLDGNPILGP